MKLALALLLVPPSFDETPEMPAGAVRYERDGWTQALYRSVNNFNHPPYHEIVVLEYTRLDKIDTRWHQSGGMRDVPHTSRKFRSLPPKSPVEYRMASVPVVNSFGFTQHERGLTRSYPDGTRFDDVLSYRGRIFEHRVREKVAGEWKNRVVAKVVEARPPGYVGLTQSCSSCHSEAGTGKYGAGLVPGGDGVLSDPMDWSKVR